MDTLEAVTRLDASYDAVKLYDEYLSLYDGVLPQKHSTKCIYSSLTGYQIECAYTLEVCEIVRKTFDFNFATYRQIPDGSTLSWHQDTDLQNVSYHIPIKTNSAAFFVYGDRTYRMPDLGGLYVTLNQDWHTFFNAGIHPRVHIHFINDLGGDYIRGHFKG